MILKILHIFDDPKYFDLFLILLKIYIFGGFMRFASSDIRAKRILYTFIHYMGTLVFDKVAYSVISVVV